MTARRFALRWLVRGGALGGLFVAAHGQTGVNGGLREERVQPSGLRVWRFPTASTSAFRIVVLVGVGARDESDEHAGISHFLEHCVLNSSVQRSGEELHEGVRALGGEYNGATSSETTSFELELPVECWRYGVDWMAEVVTRPALHEAEVKNERGIVHAELVERDEHIAGDRLADVLFGDHPLARSIGGSKESLWRTDAGDLRAWYERYYRASNLVVAWSAPEDAVAHDACVQRITTAFAGVPTGALARTPQPPHTTTGRHLLGAGASRLDGTFLAGFHVPPGDVRDLAALLVLSRLVNEGLFEEVRERRGLSYSPSAHAVVNREAWRLESLVSVPEQASLDDAWEGAQQVFAAVATVAPGDLFRARSDMFGDLDALGARGLRRWAELTWMITGADGAAPDLPLAIDSLSPSAVAERSAAWLVEDQRYLLSDSAAFLGRKRWLISFVLAGLTAVGLLAYPPRVWKHRLPALPKWRRRRPPLKPTPLPRADPDAVERELQRFFEEQDRRDEHGDG